MGHLLYEDRGALASDTGGFSTDIDQIAVGRRARTHWFAPAFLFILI